MTLRGDLQAHMSWGILLITDEESTEAIPQWASDADQVTTARTAAVVRVRHQDEGRVTVRVWDGPEPFDSRYIFSGELDVPSGVLRVSDALGDTAVRIPVGPGTFGLEIYADADAEPSEIDLVVRSIV